MSEHTNDTDVMLSAMQPDHELNTNTDADAFNDDNKDNEQIEHNDNDVDDVESEDKVNIKDVEDETLKDIDEDRLNHKDNDDELANDSEEVSEDMMMLSTIDNPHSPKTEYELWQRWDQENGHNTEAYIARLVTMDEDFDADDDDEFMLNVITSRVINEILENDSLEIYLLV